VIWEVNSEMLPEFTPRRKYCDAKRMSPGLMLATQVFPKRRRVVMKTGGFGREAAKLRLLQGAEHVVQLLDESDDEKTLVLPWAAGGDLYKRIHAGSSRRSSRGLPVEVVRKFTRQLVVALGACHSRGIIHGDVKPENILVDKKGDVVLADFDRSILIGDWRTLSLEERASILEEFGTFEFTSPELHPIQNCAHPVSEHDDVVSTATDVWCLGLVVFEMITGKGLLEAGMEEWPCVRCRAPRLEAKKRCAGCLDTCFSHLSADPDAVRTLLTTHLRDRRNGDGDSLFKGAADLIVWCCAMHPEARPVVSQLLDLDFVTLSIL
jgi:serine/threonine protein kinase